VERIASSVRSEVKHVMEVAAYTKGKRENGKRAEIVLPSYSPEVVMFSDPTVLIGVSWTSVFHIHGSHWTLLSSMAHFLFFSFITTFQTWLILVAKMDIHTYVVDYKMMS
jgi:hypothetical protein